MNAGDSAEIAQTIANVRRGFRDVAAARLAAGVEPGEPLLGLDLPTTGLHDCISCGEPLDGDDPNEVCDECCPCGCPICVHETTGCRACWPECQIPHADAVAASDARVISPASTDGSAS